LTNKKNRVAPYFLFLFSVVLSRLVVLHIHLRCARKLSLEEVNGERNFVARATRNAELLIAGFDHLARCVVVPRRVLAEQNAELLHHISQLLFGEGQPLLRVRVSTRFLAVYSVVQVGLLVIVQHDALALEQA